MTDLLQRVEASMLHRRLIPEDETLMVAVSGGLDSMVLLHLLNRLSAPRRWKIAVAHFNHHLRGRASDADEALVRKTARRLRLPFLSAGADVGSFARRAKISTEMAARKLRHEFFARAARRRGWRRLVLAHQADDQVELFFLRLLRGAGAEGLAGMKWKSPSPADSQLMLVRPLLDVSREEIRRFAAENKIRFREDATNANVDILRNRIRHELLPLLRKNYQPGLTLAILRTMEIVGAEAELVADVAATIPAGAGGSGPAFDHLPVALQR
ncbi:MAG TPA: tRNA lysidine(34) synthetase TilS, partial [Verrucomicrobiae bacterium]|nr:tRNA lysidine(34) synthetase TilS [Verrucomicrobiae bacterium]